MTFEEYQRRSIGVAFIAGPLLVVFSALTWLFGIDRNPGKLDWGSGLEGVVGFFGYTLLIPVFLVMAGWLGRSKPKLAAVIAAVALVGLAGAIANMTLRATVPAIEDAGASRAVLDELGESTDARLLALLLTGPLGPISSLLLGIGFLRAKRIRLQAWLLVVAGISLPVGQAAEVLPEVFYTAAVVIWAVVFVPIGIRMVRGEEPLAEAIGPLRATTAART